MFGYTCGADKSLSGDSSRRVNLVLASRPSTPNSKSRHAVATSCRNEVFRAGTRQLVLSRSCLLAAQRWTELHTVEWRAGRSTSHWGDCGVAADVRYWMSVGEWLPSVSRDDVRVDGHADVDDQRLPSRSAPHGSSYTSAAGEQIART